jgi:hypothetical protein
MALESIRENMKTSEPQSIGCYELKQHKAFFDEK